MDNKEDEDFNYGYKRYSIIACFGNCVYILFGISTYAAHNIPEILALLQPTPVMAQDPTFHEHDKAAPNEQVSMISFLF